MKKLYAFLLFFGVGLAMNAQIVTIPNAAFKTALLNATASNTTAKDLSGNYFKIDANSDGQIQTAEAVQVSQLNVSFLSITSLVGIQSFTNLVTLNCNDNSLTSLNVSGLSNLQTLNCYNNFSLSSLNITGLTSLKFLSSYEGLLTSLDLSGSPLLEEVHCSQNQLTSLNVNGLNQLKILYLDTNLVTSLNVSSLSSIQDLSLVYNRLTSLNVSGLTTLTDLDCTNNLLTSLTLTGCVNLKNINCGGNQLTSVALSDLASLERFSCTNNQFTSLNFNGLVNFKEFYCYSNPLVSLFIKNGRNETTLEFSGNPTMRYVCVDESQQTSVQTKVTNYGYTNCQVNSYCSFTPGGTIYAIQGTDRSDLNSNGCDASDVLFPNLKFNVATGANTTTIIANNSGTYYIAVPAGTHTVTPVLEHPTYYTVSPATLSASFPVTASPLIQNFCIAPNGTHNDLEVFIVPVGIARPGFDALYKIIYKNKGNLPQSGVINFTFNDAVLDFVSATPATSSQSLNNLVWNFTNLQPFTSREITLTLNLNSPTETPPLSLGTVLNYTVTVTGATDDTPIDNTFTLNQTTVNSMDPNDKTCLEGTTIPLSQVGKYVHYTVRFQNDGTANAQNIVIKDMIDTAKFDVSTLIPLTASHAFETKISQTNKVEFIFQNINLPFLAGSNTGYITFKIKTKSTLVLGNTFSNTASIYFDYNFPIITNNYTTTVAALDNQDFDLSKYISLFPNPAKDILNLQSKNGIEVSSMSIYNALGQLILVIPNAKETNSINISGLTNGTYFLRIASDKGMASAKFIKE